MKTKNKTIALLEIAIVLCSLVVVAIPVIAADQNTQKVSASTSAITTASEYDLYGFTLDIYGNANEDNTIDMRDTTYIKLAIFGKKPKTDLADANNDGKISMLDVGQTKLIILGKEKELTFLDMADRVVTVDKPITKMMTEGQGMHQIVRTLKSVELLVATDKSIQETWPKLFPELVCLPIWGYWNSMDYEVVLELEPEIFITVLNRPATELSAHTQAFISKLEPAGIKVIAVGTHHPEEVMITVRKLGYVLDKEREADEFMDFYAGVLNTIVEKTEKIPEKDRPRVAIGRNIYSLAVGGSGYDEYVVRAGGINIGADLEGPVGSHGSVKVDPEWVIEQNPEVYVLRIGYGEF